MKLRIALYAVWALLSCGALYAGPGPYDKSQCFIENRGQWPSEVLFLARNNGENIWITRNGAVYDHFEIASAMASKSMLPDDSHHPVPYLVRGHVVGMRIDGSSFDPDILPRDKQNSYYNYFRGRDRSQWVSGVNLYKEVGLGNIYEGIDIRYYFDEGSVRYDYIVSPGSDPSQIRMSFEGQDGLDIGPFGELILNTSLGEVKHCKIYAYQESGGGRKTVDARFISDGHVIRFECGDYDPNRELIIDPLIWSTYLGGNNKEGYNTGYYTGRNSIVLGPDRNIYVTGGTLSANFPSTTGAYDEAFDRSHSAVFVSLLSHDGSNLEFSTFIEGNGVEDCNSIELDSLGNVWITGFTGSSDFPVTIDAIDTTCTNNDIFISKLSADGSRLLYSTLLGGAGIDVVTCHQLDNLGNIYLTGYTTGHFPTTRIAYDRRFDSTGTGTFDIFVTKMRADGSDLIYSTYIGGSRSDKSLSLAVDANHYVYITGHTGSRNFPTTPGAYQRNFDSGTTDCFILKLNNNGSDLVFSTYLGGESDEYGNSVVLDRGANPVITGVTQSSRFPIVGGVDDRKSGGTDAFVSSVSSDGRTLRFSTYLGGQAQENASSLALDEFDNIYIVGNTESEDFPTTRDAMVKKIVDEENMVFTTMLSPDAGEIAYSTLVGESNISWFYYFEPFVSILLDSANNVYLSGHTGSQNFPATYGAYDTDYNGGITDLFVIKFSLEAFKIEDIDRLDYCIDDEFEVPYYTNMHFNSDNVFTAQLSDPFGNFSNPRAIGSRAGTTTGIIDCRIPEDIQYGSAYRIRVVSSSPYRETADNSRDITIYQFPEAEIIGDNKYCNDDSLHRYYDPVVHPATRNTWIVEGGSVVVGKDNYADIKWDSSDIHRITLIQTNNGGCSDTATFEVEVYDRIISDIEATREAFCIGESSTLTAHPEGYMYIWSTGETSRRIVVDTTGLYSVKVFSVYGCRDTSSIKINAYDTIPGEIYVSGKQLCAGQPVVLTAWPPGLDYYWNTGENRQQIKVGESGKYTVIMESGGGCRDTVSIELEFIESPEASIIASAEAICSGNSVTLTAMPENLEYHWSTGQTTRTIIVDTPGQYSLTVINENGCTDDAEIEIKVSETPDAQITASKNIICEGEISTLTANPEGHLYKWSNGQTTRKITVSNAGRYYVQVSTPEGCRDTASIEIEKYDKPEAEILSAGKTICGGEALTLTAKPDDMEYLWNTGDISQEITVASGGVYKVIVRKGTGCPDTASIEIKAFEKPDAEITAPASVICAGATMDLTAFPNGMQYTWNTGDRTQTISITEPGVYKVIVRNSAGCRDTAEVEIGLEPPPDLNIIGEKIICAGASSELSANEVFAEYLWSTGETAPSISVSQAGEYWLEVRTAGGCEGRDTIRIDEINIELPKLDGHDFGIVDCSRDHEYIFEFHNPNKHPITISDISKRGNRDEFDVWGNLPAVIPGGAVVRFTLVFRPESTGQFSEIFDIIISEPCGAMLEYPVSAECSEQASRSAVSVWLPDIESTPGKHEDIPLKIRLDKGDLPASFDYNARIKFSVDCFLPDNNAGNIQNDYVIIDLSGRADLNSSGEHMIARIPGIALLGEKLEYTLIIDKFEIADTSFTIYKKDGSISVRNMCLDDLRLIRMRDLTRIDIAPNPGSDMIEIRVHSATEGPSRLNIYSLAGGELYEYQWQADKGSDRVINLDAREYQTGTYFIILRTPGGVLREQFMIVK
ncbi:MAG: SBBP repeat-containing protein [Candidatus Kapaibacterium sp.]